MTKFDLMYAEMTLDWTWIGLIPDNTEFCWFWIGSGL